jgi:hypothetical protein
MASGWRSRTAIVVRQDLRPGFGPRNGLHLSVADVLDPATDFLGPGRFGILIRRGIQTIEQSGGELAAVGRG